MPSCGRLAYLISEYPAISHTFILREVRQLRALNWDVHVASINPCVRAIAELTHEEREELHTTFYVKPVGITGAVHSHSRLLLRHPIDYMRGLLYAMTLAAGDPRRTLKNFLYFVEAVVILDWMRSERLNHLHVHFASEAATVGLLASRVCPMGFSFTVHGPDEFYDTSGYYLAEKIEQATFVCCISHFARSQLMRLVPSAEWKKLKLAPLGIDPTVFKPNGSRTNTGSFEILCVGRLVPTKGQHVLIGAISRLRANGQDVRLRLVGSGPDRPSLKREVEYHGLGDYVDFKGSINQDGIKDIYRNADAFVMASFAEGVPIVLMEAMGMEIPCVATHVCGIPELIRSEIEGLLVAPADDRALTAAILRLMQDQQLRLRLARAGRQRVLERYDLRRNVGRLAEIFHKHIRG